MSREIRALDAKTRDRIAAGEVIERPASAVKELVENALDADASRVDVTVESGGIEGIRVVDDGVGMDRASVERAIEEHTTSKIRDIEDLEAGVGTLGFRGEALHAIAAVSRTTITTCPRPNQAGEGPESGGEATELVVEGGEVTAIRPAGRPPGTTVAVEDLFYNVPARRKYLKQASTEFAHVNTVVARYALANPDIAVSLTHDDREIFATTGRGDLQETILSVYGREVARSMIDVEDDALPDGPLAGIGGLVSHPETNRAGREYLATYVNGRSVRSATVREAIVDAYGTQLAPDRYPFAVLFLDVDPATVDVNVHPRKREVRFADDDGVRRQVREAVEGALLREGLIRSSAPRGRSAPEQTEVSPATGEGTAAEDADNAEDGGHATKESTKDAAAAHSIQSVDSTGRDSPADGVDAADAHRTKSEEPSTADRTEPFGGDSGSAGDRPERSADQRRTTSHHHDRDRRFRGGDEQARLGGEAPEQTFDRLPQMTILGQYRETYVVAETEEGLIVIDQHAADERINYERLRERFASQTTTQTLAEPVAVELTAREAAVFEDRAAGLETLGFHAERVADRTVEVTAIPGLLAGDVGPELVRDLLGAAVETERGADEAVQDAADHLLGDLACYPSITGNTSLAEGSIRELLAALDECENPYACPHGRPVIVSITADELEDRFERDYPGHQGRRE